jgi:hypothetical protein
MKFRLATIIVCISMLQGLPSFGQTATPPAPPRPARGTPPPPPPAPPNPNASPFSSVERGGQPVNVRIDVSVIDQSAAGPAQPKTLMVLLADRAFGRTRSSFEDRTIDIDAQPMIVGSRIRVYLTIVSGVLRAPAAGPATTTSDLILNWRNSFTLLLDNEKSQIALESSEPAKNRKMSVEVKATILK